MLNPAEQRIYLDAMITGDPGGAIEREERRGQLGLAAANRLPADMSPDDRKTLEAWGVQFGERLPGVDRIFLACTLPPGWLIAPTDHAMWSRLLDDRGRLRATIFFKAAPYDYHAHMETLRRFKATARGAGGGTGGLWEEPIQGVALDGEEAIFTTTPQKASVENYTETKDALRKEAETYLDTRYPDWRNPLAYWD